VNIAVETIEHLMFACTHNETERSNLERRVEEVMALCDYIRCPKDVKGMLSLNLLNF